MRGTHPGSRDEILTLHDPLGYPQRGQPSTELEQSQLGALCHQRPIIPSPLGGLEAVDELVELKQILLVKRRRATSQRGALFPGTSVRKIDGDFVE